MPKRTHSASEGRLTPAGGADPYIEIVQPPEEIHLKLKEIDEWASSVLPLTPMETNDDFMTLAVELMNQCHILLRVGIALAPNKTTAEVGYTKRRAIVLGHLVRPYKLYAALRYHTAEKERDICDIFTRLIVETATKLEYLMKARPVSFKNFVLVAYRPERDMMKDLQQKAASRALTPIEARMMRSVRNHLREDGISLARLRATKNWDLDGKNFRQMLAELGREWAYAYGFGGGSHWVHGAWFDLKMHHLRRAGRRYKPEWRYGTPDPRGACPATILCLSCLFRLLKWNGSDPDKFLSPTVGRVIHVAQAIDAAHDQFLQKP
jgi:hypothetical protein